MGNLWALIEAYLDSQGGMASAALARKIGTKPQTVSSWKVRGSRPEAKILRDLAKAIDVDYEVLLAAVDADAGYRTDEELLSVLKDRNIPADVQERLRRHVSYPLPNRNGALRKDAR